MNYYNYFSEIEEMFVRRRGRNLLLSPLDWALIEDWKERGIPLRIVLNGIEKVFDHADKQPSKKQTIKSLTYCREEIEAQYSDWLVSQTGKKDDGKTQSLNSANQNSETENVAKNESNLDETTVFHLEKVSDELNESLKKTDGELRQILESCQRELKNFKQNPPTVKILEKALEEMDARIDAILLKTEATEQLKSEIEKQIASYKNKMEHAVYQRTFDLMVVKRLREKTKIPRLNLFYL